MTRYTLGEIESLYPKFKDTKDKELFMFLANEYIRQLLTDHKQMAGVLGEMLGSPVRWSDKDNMEFDYRHTTFTIEKARQVLAQYNEYYGEK